MERISIAISSHACYRVGTLTNKRAAKRSGASWRPVGLVLSKISSKVEKESIRAISRATLINWMIRVQDDIFVSHMYVDLGNAKKNDEMPEENVIAKAIATLRANARLKCQMSFQELCQNTVHRGTKP